MSDPQAPCCALCGREMRHDTAEVCDRCGLVLRRALERTARLAHEIEATIARLDVGIARGPGQPDLDGWERNADALEPIELPVRAAAIVDRDAVINELATWARHIAAERGCDLPPTQDPVRGSTGPTGGPLGILALWLRPHIEWLRHRPEGQEAIAALSDACATASRIPDQRARRHLVGKCQECEAPLYALEGDTAVACEACGAEAVSAEATRRLLEDGRDRRVSAADAARLIVAANPLVPRTRIGNLIRQWAHRDLIEADEQGRYELGQILDRWTRALAARVA